MNWEEIDQIQGWLFKEEAELLDELNVGRWCEIGSWKGKSTAVLASKQKGYAIDWFKGIEDEGYGLEGVDTFDEFVANTKPYRENIVILPMHYKDAEPFIPFRTIDLLFLDGTHNYEDTFRAWELYNLKVAAGGHVVFHDAWGENGERGMTPFPEVTKVVKEINDTRWVHLPGVRRCAVFQRVGA